MEQQLRWIPAQVQQVDRVGEHQYWCRVFLPSFTRFEGLAGVAVVAVKQASGVGRDCAIVAHDPQAQCLTLLCEASTAEPALMAFFQQLAPGQLLEISGPKAPAQAIAGIDFYVELARQGKTIAVPVGVSIADALREHHVKVNTSCEYGVCGTCYTDVLAGEPVHEDTYLMDDEKAANDCIMICVSRAAPGSVLVLDL